MAVECKLDAAVAQIRGINGSCGARVSKEPFAQQPIPCTLAVSPIVAQRHGDD